MKLLSLYIGSKNNSNSDKWHSKRLQFGDDITLLFGNGGCAKTPMIRFIVYCLGYNSIFQNDIYANCDYAHLVVSIRSNKYILKRRVDKSTFDITVSKDGAKDQLFYNEAVFTSYFFQLLGISYIALISPYGKPVRPYMSILLPLHYIDQDEGYKKFYYSLGTFIKDQAEEMIRLSLDLPIKHSFDQKKNIISLKKELESLDKRKVLLEEQMIDVKTSMNDPKCSIDDLNKRINYLGKQLDDLKGNSSVNNEATRLVDELIKDNKSLYYKKNVEINNLTTKVQGFASIKNEIQVEIDTLSLNEEARRVFSSFSDICSNPECSLFTKSSNSYGKNLLYLKDQIKDLERNNGIQKRRIEDIQAQQKFVLDEIENLKRKRKELYQSDEVASLVEAIGSIMEEMFVFQKDKKILEQVDSLENNLVELLNRRGRIQDEIDNSGKVNSAGTLVSKFRIKFRDSIRKWLDILGTKNVSSSDEVNFSDVGVSSNFSLKIKDQAVRQFSGGTRARIILASFAAFFELYLDDLGRPLRFLILDTPKQHEIADDDLNNYFLALKELAHKKSAQVIFSSTGYHYDGDAFDDEWQPSFLGEEQNMFLSSGEKN